jgi:hypothetical protein
MDWVAGSCPATKIDAMTPETWFEILKDLNFADAKLAVTEIGKRQPWVHASEIRDEVRAIREDRIQRAPLVDADLFGPDDRYRPQLVAYLEGIADGDRGLALVTGSMRALEAGSASGPSEASVQARAVMRGGDAEFVRLRDRSMAVECTYCGMPPGQPCVNLTDFQVLAKSPAHLERLQDVGLEPRRERRSIEAQKVLLLKLSAEHEEQNPPGRP